jgi:predicted Holliday junction resolvase-like endonuclease
MTLTPELQALLVALVTAVVGAVIAYLEKLRRDLAANTEKTEQIQKQTNGERTKLINENQKLRLVAESYRDIVRFVQSTPEGRTILERWDERRRVSIRDTAIEELEARILREDAHP